MRNIDNEDSSDDQRQREQPMALAIPQQDGSFRLLDAATYRWIPVRVVVKCPDGEVYFAPEEELRRLRQKDEVAKIRARRARKKSSNSDPKELVPEPPPNFATEVFGAMGHDVVNRIRESVDG